MNWCRTCLMPSTRPDLHMDQDGTCDACASAKRKHSVNWQGRRAAWKELCAEAKSRSRAEGSPYDCIAAVSGGKDSTFIVHTALLSGLHVLGVCFEPSQPTQPGIDNLANLSRFCDVIQVRKNCKVYNRIRRIALREVGDAEWPNHVGIFTSVIREADLRRIPLVLWGENPQAEYGGPDRAKDPKPLDRAWLEEYGGLLGMRMRDLIDEHGFTEDELRPYEWPNDCNAQSVFLGDYLPWDSVAQARLVRDQRGFQWSDVPPFGSAWPYENLDDSIAVVFHDFLALAKFGYSRAHAQLSIEVRHGHRSRESAPTELTRLDVDRYPPEEIEAAFCDGIGLGPDEVRAACAAFLNRGIWTDTVLTPGCRLTRKVAPCAT